MEEKISIIVVDDEPEARDLLVTLLDEYKNFEVIAQAESVDEALLAVAQTPPDLIFLDIHMPKKNGFELAIAMRNLKLKSEIIFVTAYDQYAIQAVKTAAFDYLLKPINEEELREAIIRYQLERKNTDLTDRIEALYGTLNNTTRLRFSTRSGFTFISMDNIVYMEADGNYTIIRLLNGKDETITQSLGQIEMELPTKDFFRVNRSNIINLKFLTRVNRKAKTCHISTGKSEAELTISSDQIKILESLKY